jgi:hypothetical protein
MASSFPARRRPILFSFVTSLFHRTHRLPPEPPPHRAVCPPSSLLRQAAGAWLDKLEAGCGVNTVEIKCSKHIKSK